MMLDIKETDGGGKAYTYNVSCHNEDTEDTEDSHVYVLCGCPLWLCALLPILFPLVDMVIG